MSTLVIQATFSDICKLRDRPGTEMFDVDYAHHTISMPLANSAAGLGILDEIGIPPMQPTPMYVGEAITLDLTQREEHTMLA